VTHAQELDIRAAVEGIEDLHITRADDSENVAYAFEA
jgi:hypothetical protein